MDIDQIRKTNLRSVVATRSGTQTAAAVVLDTTKTYLCALMKPVDPTADEEEQKKVKRVGEKFARRVEKKYDLPDGWMDVDHSGPQIAKLARLNTQQVLDKAYLQEPTSYDEFTFQRVGPHTFAFLASDTSMTGEVERGDTVIVDPNGSPIEGALVLIRTKTTVQIRKYTHTAAGDEVFVATNTNFPLGEGGPLSCIEIVGVVVEVCPPRRILSSLRTSEEEKAFANLAHHAFALSSAPAPHNLARRS